MRKRRRASVFLAVATILGSGTAVAEPTGAAPADTVASRAAATPDSSDALSGYLGRLSATTNDDFGLRELTISDAEVDSLIRAYEASGEAPAGAGRSGWRANAGLGGFRYSRVEGANVMAEAEVVAPTSRALEVFGRGGYGWASEKATWRGGLRAGLSAATMLEVIYTRDVWAYGAGGVPGNSLLALTAGRDLDDYFLVEGWSTSLHAAPGPMRVAASWTDEDQQSLRNATDFTLFDEGGKFRVNPPIRDGRSRRVELSLGIGETTRGRWAVDVAGAVAGRTLGGDFDYEKGTALVRARRPLWFGDEIRVALDGAIVSGEAPFQALHFLGGPKRLRGYDINEIPARQAVHFAGDYAMGTNPLGWLPYVRRFRVQPIPFFDAALIRETQTASGERVEPDSPWWRFDAGLGLQYNAFGIPGGSGQVRLDIARRLDRDDDNVTYRLGFTLRR